MLREEAQRIATAAIRLKLPSTFTTEQHRLWRQAAVSLSEVCHHRGDIVIRTALYRLRYCLGANPCAQ